MDEKKTAYCLLFVFCFLPGLSAGADMEMKDKVCSFIIPVMNAISAMGGTLLVIMLIFGGVKYTFSADDAGGRKEGKNMIIHAVIGGILLSLVSIIAYNVLNIGSQC